MKLPISTIVLTYNEENNIKDCLNSVFLWSDEIIIVDSDSSDKTVEIAKSYTNKIYEHSFKNYAKQRNWAQENIPLKNEWVFHLDADERVSQELVSELRKLFCSKIDTDGFMMPRRTNFRGRWIRHGGHYPVYHLRIFRKSKGKCEEKLYDQHFMVSGKTTKLKGNIINIIEPDLNIFRNKHRKWARLEAQQVLTGYRLQDTGYKPNPIKKRRWLKQNIYYRMPPFVRPILYFLYRYIFRLGFLDGKEGFLFHFWQGFWFRFLVDMKIHQLQKGSTW